MRRNHFGRWLATAATAAALAGFGCVAHGAQADPAASQIEGFDAQLIDVMKQAKALGFEGRYRKLEPVVDRQFDIPFMIRVAVGPAWSTLPAGQQQQLTEAFRRLTVASFAHNFGGYSGQAFEINPSVVTRGPDKVVQTTLVSPHDQPIAISYRMRQGAGGGWKIIDVFYNGAISQLSTRRSDFQSTLEHGGASALVSHLNALVDKEMK